VRFALTHPPAGYTLVWQTVHATTVTLNELRVGSSGQMRLRPPVRSASYRLIAANGVGASTARVHVTVSVPPAPGMRVYRLNLPQIVAVRLRRAGGGVVLSWEVRGARRVWLRGRAVAARGAQAVPWGITVVELVAANDVGVQRRLIYVPHIAPPSVPRAATRPTRVRRQQIYRHR
jgi:hypothetical protein